MCVSVCVSACVSACVCVCESVLPDLVRNENKPTINAIKPIMIFINNGNYLLYMEPFYSVLIIFLV